MKQSLMKPLSQMFQRSLHPKPLGTPKTLENWNRRKESQQNQPLTSSMRALTETRMMRKSLRLKSNTTMSTSNILQIGFTGTEVMRVKLMGFGPIAMALISSMKPIMILNTSRWQHLSTWPVRMAVLYGLNTCMRLFSKRPREDQTSNLRLLISLYPSRALSERGRMTPTVFLFALWLEFLSHLSQPRSWPG